VGEIRALYIIKYKGGAEIFLDRLILYVADSDSFRVANKESLCRDRPEAIGLRIGGLNLRRLNASRVFGPAPTMLDINAVEPYVLDGTAGDATDDRCLLRKPSLPPLPR
jgi:hypothetical protein